MTPTRRGLAVFGIALWAFLMAGAFGARSLNAVAVPALIALAAAVLQVYTLSAPSVSREVPASAARGESIPVRLRLDADDPFPGTVRDTFRNGDSEPITVETVVGEDDVTADVTCRQRGEAAFGPVEIVATDVLGLVRREFVVHATDSLLVYPRVSPLKQTIRHELVALGQTHRDDGRESFEHLREYERGDTLRDVNWKASAKRDDLVVTEYAADRPNTPLTIATGGDDADGFADATASIALALLDAGVPVTVQTPEASMSLGQREHRQRLLSHLAQVDAGPVPNTEADIVVRTRQGRTTVTLDDRSRDFRDVVHSAGADGSDDTESPRVRSTAATGDTADPETEDAHEGVHATP